MQLHLHRGLVSILFIGDLRTKGIRRATAAKENAAIRRLGEIHDCVPRRGDALSSLPPNLQA